MSETESRNNFQAPEELRALLEKAESRGVALQETCETVTRGLNGTEAIDSVLTASTFLAEFAALFATSESEPVQFTLIGQRTIRPSPISTGQSAIEELICRALESGGVEPCPLPPDAAAIALPIKLVKNPVAVLYLARPSGPAFSSADLAAAQMLVTIAAPLFRMEQLQLASQELVVQQERSRIAREIHDGVSQNLALLMLKMEIISRLADSDPARLKSELAKVASILETSVHELRRAVYTLRSPNLARVGLISALNRLAHDFAEQTNTEITLDLPPALSLSPQIQSAVFSVVQDRLNVLAKDGSATDVAVQLELRADRLLISLRDNCQPTLPFPPAAESDPSTWQVRLTERVQPLRGTIQLVQHPPETRLEISIPYK